MNFLLYLHIAYIFYVYSSSLEINPSCRHCKFYRPNLNAREFSKCTRFGERIRDKNIFIYEYADLVRLDEAKCGPQGKFYQNRDYRDMIDIITDQHLSKEQNN